VTKVATAVVTILLLAATSACGGADADPATIAGAKRAYAAAKARGVDMTNGPCLGIVAPDWVADVAHDPRRAVDDDPANQCAAYRSGEAHHFVELDPEGNVIRSG
jgi:hypothetical protein